MSYKSKSLLDSPTTPTTTFGKKTQLYTTNSSYDYLFRIIILGDVSVGKSSLLLKLSDDIFFKEHIPTVGVDLKVCIKTVNGNNTKIQIFDTAGQEKYKMLISSYIKHKDGAIVMFDVTNYISFNDVRLWISEIKKYAGTIPMIYVVGNKKDLYMKRTVSYDVAKKFTDDNNLKYFETSCYDRKSIDDLFQNLTKDMIENVHEKTDESTTVLLHKPKYNIGCCNI
jgi:Ras-related protein Rab-1A